MGTAAGLSVSLSAQTPLRNLEHRGYVRARNEERNVPAAPLISTVQVQKFGDGHTRAQVSRKGKGWTHRTKHRQFVFQISVGKRDLWRQAKQKGKHSVTRVSTALDSRNRSNMFPKQNKPI